MTDRHILYKLQPGVAGQAVADSADIETDPSVTGLPTGVIQVEQGLTSLQSQISEIVVPTPPSFRPFRIFNGGTLVSNVNFRHEEITLDGSNLSDWSNINSIYAAGRVDKRVDILLPTDAEIAASGEAYPIPIEVTHLGGTARVPTDGRPNVVNFIVKPTDTGTDIETVRLGDRDNTSLQQGDVVVLVKSAAGQNWVESRRTSNPSENLLPSGVFDLQEDLVIDNISNFQALLTGRVITSGQAFHVTTGGTYFGGHTVPNGSALVALTNNPSLADVNTNNDWLIIENAASAAADIRDRLLLNQFAQSGTRFDASRNVFVNEANVIQFRSSAPASPITFPYFTSSGDGSTARTATFTGQPIQFSDLVGGTLTLNASFATNRQSGFLPELTSISLTFGTTVFTFPLGNIDPQSGIATVSIAIPNADYSGILNSTCDVTLNYQFRGASFVGSFTIMSVVNTLDGTLRQSVTDIANAAAMLLHHYQSHCQAD